MYTWLGLKFSGKRENLSKNLSMGKGDCIGQPVLAVAPNAHSISLQIPRHSPSPRPFLAFLFVTAFEHRVEAPSPLSYISLPPVHPHSQLRSPLLVCSRLRISVLVVVLLCCRVLFFFVRVALCCISRSHLLKGVRQHVPSANEVS